MAYKAVAYSALAQRRTGKKPSVRSTETHQPRWTTGLVKPWAGLGRASRLGVSRLESECLCQNRCDKRVISEYRFFHSEWTVT